MVEYDPKTNTYRNVDSNKKAFISADAYKKRKISGPINISYIDEYSLEHEEEYDETAEIKGKLVSLGITEQNCNYLDLAANKGNTNIIQYINDLIYKELRDRFHEIKNFKEISSKIDKESYTLKELSEILKVTVGTLQTYIKNGKLKAKKIGGKWIVTREALESLIKTR